MDVYTTPRLKLLPLREQPATRIAANSSACNLPELLSAIIGGAHQIETAEAILAHFGDLTRLQQAHVTELAQIKGVGKQTAVRLKAALAVAVKAVQDTFDERPTIHNPTDAAALVQYEMALLEQEHLRTILLDTRNRVIDIVEVYRGSLNAAQVCVAEVFKLAIRRNANALIVCHNHPSGDPTPTRMTLPSPALSLRQESCWTLTCSTTWLSTGEVRLAQGARVRYLARHLGQPDPKDCRINLRRQPRFRMRQFSELSRT